jgi:hypothetical protein
MGKALFEEEAVMFDSQKKQALQSPLSEAQTPAAGNGQARAPEERQAQPDCFGWPGIS